MEHQKVCYKLAHLAKQIINIAVEKLIECIQDIRGKGRLTYGEKKHRLKISLDYLFYIFLNLPIFVVNIYICILHTCLRFSVCLPRTQSGAETTASPRGPLAAGPTQGGCGQRDRVRNL
jgi:hypothetical protein